VDVIAQLDETLGNLPHEHSRASREMEQRHEPATAIFPMQITSQTEFDFALARYFAALAYPSLIHVPGAELYDWIGAQACEVLSGWHPSPHHAFLCVRDGMEGGRRGFLLTYFDRVKHARERLVVSMVIRSFERSIRDAEFDEYLLLAEAMDERFRGIDAPSARMHLLELGAYLEKLYWLRVQFENDVRCALK